MKTLLKNVVVWILTKEAKMLLVRKQPTIVAITGSVGKTSTKDAIYSVLKRRVHARKSEKSYNSELGVPLSVLGLESGWNDPIHWLKNIIDGFMMIFHRDPYPKVLILEMGVDRPGDMEKLTSWIKPDVVVLTRLPDVPVHVEFFSSPEAVVAEKWKLVEALKADGVLVYNQDDPKIQELAETVSQRKIGYSRNSLSPFTGSADKIVYENGKAIGFEFMLTHYDESVLVRVSGSLGIPHVYSYAAAIATGSIFDISIKDASASLREHIPPSGRMRLIAGIKDTLIIDDTYNSSPTACEQALETIRGLRGTRRRVAVLGDMLELGQYSIGEHEHIGELVPSSVDVLFTVGVRARSIASRAIEKGMAKDAVFAFDDGKRVSEELKRILEAGDVVLIKGSQGVRLERVVRDLMADPKDADTVLVRQGVGWRDR